MNNKPIPKPVFGTQEWAEKNKNLLKGCSHDCKYCYAKAGQIRRKRSTPEDWKNEIIRKPQKLTVTRRKVAGRIMFPTTHDITPMHLNECVVFMEAYLRPGNRLLIVSKPYLDCIKKMCTELIPFKEQILFRFTIGSADSQILRFWEPGAPDFNERLESLQHAFNAGFSTSVSSEPMLDNQVERVIDATLPFITDSIWIGKPNKLMERLKMNGHGNLVTLEKARGLMSALSDEYILGIYELYKNNPRVKWKESCKKVLGIEIPTEAGLDV